MHMYILKHFISSVGNMHLVMNKNYSGGAALGIHTHTHKYKISLPPLKLLLTQKLILNFEDPSIIKVYRDIRKIVSNQISIINYEYLRHLCISEL